MTDFAAGAIALQTTSSLSVMRDRLLSCLSKPNLARIRIAVAYARWDGIGLLSNAVESFLSNGGKIETIFGAGNGVTTPDSLLYGVYLKEIYGNRVYSGAVQDTYANSIFHPKYYEFDYGDHYVVLIGSANLTGGGLLRNTELGLEFCAQSTSPVYAELNANWLAMKSLAAPVTPALVRKIVAASGLGSEADRGEGRAPINSKPFIKTGHKVAPKPLFKKVLELKKPAKKSKVLAGLDTLSTKPDVLYLQILETETGGSGGSEGYQVQLPVATLGSYFGVGVNQKREATFKFDGEPSFTTNVTHFSNNTHRVRLRPILKIARPAILKFVRTASDTYDVSVVKKSRYANVLATKCPEQSRAGARRWGLE